MCIIGSIFSSKQSSVLTAFGVCVYVCVLGGGGGVRGLIVVTLNVSRVPFTLTLLSV